MPKSKSRKPAPKKPASKVRKAPQVPASQPGDAPADVAKAQAQPVLQSHAQAKEELAANPGRTSALSNVGHVVRE
jgi:hypothetical protein